MLIKWGELWISRSLFVCDLSLCTNSILSRSLKSIVNAEKIGKNTVGSIGAFFSSHYFTKARLGRRQGRKRWFCFPKEQCNLSEEKGMLCIFFFHLRLVPWFRMRPYEENEDVKYWESLFWPLQSPSCFHFISRVSSKEGGLDSEARRKKVRKRNQAPSLAL